MKKLIAILAVILMVSPALAISSVDEGKAKVKVGSVKANIKNSKEDQMASITKSGNTVTFGATYLKTKIKGIKSSIKTISLVLQFDSVEGDFESGKTYDLSNSNPDFANAFVVATQFKNLKSKGFGTLFSQQEEIPIATGQFKVKSFNPDTNEVTGDLSVQVTPYTKIKGSKNKVLTKPLKIKMKINTIVQ